MTLFGRLKYAAFLTVAVVMGTGMIGMITGLDENGVLFQPTFVVSTFVLAFIVAPWVVRHLPFKRNSDSE
jgi:flagellar biosynthesis protein FliQ